MRLCERQPVLFKVEVTRLWKIQDADVRLRPPDQTSPGRGGNGNVSAAGRRLELTFPLEVADMVTGLENPATAGRACSFAFCTRCSGNLGPWGGC